MMGGTCGTGGGVGVPGLPAPYANDGGQQKDQEPSGGLRADGWPSAGVNGFSGRAQTVTLT